MENKTYDVNEVAQMLNVSENSVRELIRQGKIKKLPISKPIRIAQSAIDNFLGLPMLGASVNRSDEVVFKKKEVLELISSITEIQQIANKVLVLLQTKLSRC